MPLSLWLSLVTACIVISFTPGAGAIYTMSSSLSQGWRRAFWAVLGLQIALVIHVVVVAAGVGLVVANSPVLFTAIRYAGAAYLAYLGIRLMLTRPAIDTEDGPPAVSPRDSRWAMIRRGLWVNLLNPKAVVFFLAFIPQFIRLDQPPLAQYLIFIITVMIVDVFVMWGFYASAARSFQRVTHTRRGQRTLNTIFGVLYIGVAVLLLFIH